ncbi:MAG: twin-arginine translocation signal domain-containing protein [Acidobacteria bacterium]|nr:twin-arginine translocation signal domain-containing protein [Acidobacteriota bacterium]
MREITNFRISLFWRIVAKRENKNLTRRDLLKTAAAAGAGMGLAGLSEEAVSAAPAGRSVRGMKFEKRDTVRLGIIGVGGRGTGVMREFLAVDNVEVVAVCDVVKEKTERAQKYVEKAGKKTPPLISRTIVISRISASATT